MIWWMNGEQGGSLVKERELGSRLLSYGKEIRAMERAKIDLRMLESEVMGTGWVVESQGREIPVLLLGKEARVTAFEKREHRWVQIPPSHVQCRSYQRTLCLQQQTQ